MGAAPDSLRRTGELFRLMIDAVQDYAIFMLDRDGRVATWNAGAQRIKGYTAGEILGQHFSRFYPSEDVTAGEPERALAAAAAEGRFADEGWRVRQDGRRFWASVSITAMRDDAGDVRGFAKVTRDLTAQRRTGEQLRSLAQLPAENPNPVLRIARDGQVLYANRAAEDVLSDQGWHRDLPAPPAFRDTAEAALASGTTRRLEVRRENTRIVSFECIAPPAKEYVNLYGRDVTEAREAEHGLRRSEAEFRAFFDNAAVGTAQLDREGRFLQVNDRYCQITGYRREELLGTSPVNLSLPEERDQYRAEIARFMRGDMAVYDVEKPYVRKDGAVIWVHVTASMLRDATGHPSGAAAVIEDVTSRRRAEAALRDRELEQRRQREFLERLVNHAPIAIGVVQGRDLRYSLMNPAYRAIVGPNVNPIGRTFREVLPEAADRGAEEGMRRVLRTGEPWRVRDFQTHVPGRTDVTCWDGEILPLPGASGEPGSLLILIWEITERRRAEDALRRSEQMLAEAGELAQLGAWWIDISDPDDLNANPLHWSEQVYRIFGYEPREVGVTRELFYQRVHPDDRRRVAEAVARAAAERTSYSLEHRIVRVDGTERVVLERAQVTYDDRGRPCRIVGAVQDITERKAAEEALQRSERRFRELADAMPQIVWAASPDGHLDYYNHQWYELTGAREGERGDRSSLPVMHPDDRGRCRALWYQAVRAGTPFEVEYRLQFPSTGEYRWHLGRALPVRDDDGTITRWYGTSTDIHDLKVAQQELAAAQASAERARTIAEDASRAKDHFLAVLSHELRTPLAPVLTGVAMLQRDETLSERARGYLEIVRRNVELESRLIDDLLDVTRIARGKLELETRRIELCTVIDRAVEVCGPDIEARRLHFGVDFGAGPYVIDADAARLQQVFWNLLKNAIKFTPHAGCVGIRCRPDEGSVVVDVMDSGIGIEPSALPHIFDAFAQAERSITQQFGGLGLGLAISKALVEAHGGTLVASSEGRDKGATFTVRLPVLSRHGRSVTEPGASAPEPSAPDRRRPLRILLVEDHGDTAELMTVVLEGAGHEVETAGDVATALLTAAQGRFDLLLSDLGLPDGTGVDLMRALRDRGHALPGIAVSGYGHEHDIQRSRAAGFVAHLVKPVDPDRLLELLDRVVRGPAAG